MKTLAKNFMNGVLTVVPIVLAIYVFIKIFTFFDGLLGKYVKPYLHETYIPGIGILCTIALITVLGWLSTQYISGRLIKLIDRLLESIPLMKTVYSVLKDTIYSFIGEKRSFSKVVLIDLPHTEIKCIGFITSEEVESLFHPLKEYVAVYIPQTFQVAGITVLVPKAQIEVINVKPEEAMKFILSGGMTASKNKEKRVE
ncbi:DUF502 domain-containing protein [Anoxybacillus rupiensis]|uniref:DUF502 domain-containing protein n=1 Tax=Anoxybacteroides rupiense TaxID=311460 RepID=A0ABD5ITB4_9BACL|nr:MULTISPECIES: DUF502 domain-containing protein [Anoxybacillus]KXG09419.1 hypothetical protein AT864_02373 [Anoxybacillus sp. P3H1B]MBB3907980.1 putative membrane protein [Anoxybacillus rupiensis]MBS2771785.1 DUF502 domain-containing protein [Anoxybacillus rupiensis]MDE8563849.1 DUF502 domain-containing protein [Anoxybacillus rupiensis]MED5051443.1 DUF502 domain-containing protein [Anoxybacillus rupiensis]